MKVRLVTGVAAMALVTGISMGSSHHAIAAEAVAEPVPTLTEAEWAEAKTQFDIILVSLPADKKIAVIKAVREVNRNKETVWQWTPADTPEFRARLDQDCRDLLSNPVIEDFRYEIAPAPR